MAYIVEPEVVKYACTCGLLKPISKLYFCRHCLELRCGYCVCHEVDSHFCGKCLENLPSTEARVKKNKCGNCVECPSCHQQLSSRAATAGPRNPEDPESTPRKVVYLLCLTCRWSTRDVGIPDQTVGNNSWPERENVNGNRLHQIQECYRAMVSVDKHSRLDKDKKKIKKYLSYSDRTGITSSILRKRLGLPDVANPLLKAKIEAPPPAVAKEDVDELPVDLFLKPIKLTDITTIDQRLLLPDWQPISVDKLYPIHKQLSVKQSLRCRSCEHNVSKPEYNPLSVKFKIQLFAYYHIPEIRIVTVEPLRAGKDCQLLLAFINPTQHQTTVSILELEHAELDSQTDSTLAEVDEKVNEIQETKEANLVKKQTVSSTGTSQPSSLLNASLTRPPSITVNPREIVAKIGADVVIPSSSFVLLPRDDAAEYDDTADNHNIKDDLKLVLYRKSNRAVIKLQITPREMSLGEEVTVGFSVRHVYTNTIVTAMENKEPQRCEHTMKVFLNLGKLVGSE